VKVHKGFMGESVVIPGSFFVVEVVDEEALALLNDIDGFLADEYTPQEFEEEGESALMGPLRKFAVALAAAYAEEVPA